jgi:RNA polymerase sigma-70 factor (ECF subfamily)
METTRSFSSNALRDFSQVDLALQGNQQAYQTLFKRYWKQLFFTVNKMIHDKEEAKDVAMEAFTKAFGNLHRFKKEYGFNTWLYRIAINHSLDFLRKKRLSTTPLSTCVGEDSHQFFKLGNDQDRQHKNAEEQIMQRQRAGTLEGIMRRLPPKYREVAILRFMEEYRYGDIAALLDLPVGTVKARVHRARYMLQQTLEPCRHYL